MLPASALPSIVGVALVVSVVVVVIAGLAIDVSIVNEIDADCKGSPTPA